MAKGRGKGRGRERERGGGGRGERGEGEGEEGRLGKRTPLMTILNICANSMYPRKLHQDLYILYIHCTHTYNTGSSQVRRNWCI